MRQYEHGGDVYGGQPPKVDFSVNVNPFGLPPEAVEALKNGVENDVKYPDPQCRELRAALAKRFFVKNENILCGCGASDLIFRIFFALRPKKTLVTAPSFSEYKRCAELCGSAVNEYFLSENDGFAVTDGFVDAVENDTEVVFLCNPNNPTGRLCDAEIIAKLAQKCKKTGAFLVIDECFLPFTDGTSAIPLLQKNDHILILRAFTKIYAMAGLRLGFVIGNAEILKKIEPFGPQWSVSTVAQRVGLAALENTGWAEQIIPYGGFQRHLVAKKLRELGLTVYPSDSNFLLVSSPLPLADELQKRGLCVRRCGNFTGLNNNFFRIGLRLQKENELLLHTIEEVLHG